MMRRADQHQVHAVDQPRVALEEIEQLGAALVLVDPPDVDGEPVAQSNFWRKRRRWCAGNLRSDADDHSGDVAGCSTTL